MPFTLTQALAGLDSGKWKPIYLAVGEEPFQAGELLDQLRKHFITSDTARDFNYEAFDGEHLDAGAFLSSLETLPGLFGGDEPRLVYCSKFDKVSSAALETLEKYFKSPSPTTCVLLTASKIDRRKPWVKAVEEIGQIVELKEPADRDWPKWHGYFEKRLGKRIELEAWELCVEGSGRNLSLVWAEVQRAATFVGSRSDITRADAAELFSPSGEGDIFAFADDVLCGRARGALSKLQYLVKNGENEIKLLAILVRQFRLVSQCAELMRRGNSDTKLIGSQLGLHPFLVSRVIGQAKHQTSKTLQFAFECLAECDFRLKTGEGGLFENFLVPYFSPQGMRAGRR